MLWSLLVWRETRRKGQRGRRRQRDGKERRGEEVKGKEAKAANEEETEREEVRRKRTGGKGGDRLTCSHQRWKGGRTGTAPCGAAKHSSADVITSVG